MKSSVPNPAINAFLDAALILHKNEEYKEALRLVKKILKLDAAAIDAAVLAGLIYQNLNDDPKAEVYFRLALSINPDYPNALRSYGLFLLSQNKYPEALNNLSKYLELNNWVDDAALNLVADLVRDFGTKEVQQEILKKAWGGNPNPKIEYLYCRNLFIDSKVDEALQILEHSRFLPSEPRELNLLAFILADQKKFERSIYFYQKAIQLISKLYDNPKRDSITENKPVYLEGLFKDNNQELEIPKLLITVWQNLSIVYLESGNAKEALNAVQQAIILAPDSYRTVSIKVNALSDLARYSEAAQILNTFLESNTVDRDDLIEVYRSLDWCLSKELKKEDEIDLLKRALKDFPLEADFHYRLSDLIYETGKPEEAIVVLENAFKVLPELIASEEENNSWVYSTYRFRLAKYLCMVGREESAKDHLRYRYGQKMTEIDSDEKSFVEIFPEENKFISDVYAKKEYAAKLIEQAYTHFAEHPVVAWMMYTLRFVQGDMEAVVDILKKAQSLPAPREMKQLFLNNLGYSYIMQGKLGLAQKALDKAVKVEKYKKDLKYYSYEIDTWTTLFAEDKFIGSKEYSKLGIPVEISSFRRIIKAVQYNRIALALAEGDADKATLLLTDVWNTYAKDGEMDTDDEGLNYIHLLCLAYLRKERKTAFFAWNKIQNSHDQRLSEHELTLLFPGIYRWLFEKKDKQAD